jgi:hypothetical protein
VVIESEEKEFRKRMPAISEELWRKTKISVILGWD